MKTKNKAFHAIYFLIAATYFFIIESCTSDEPITNSYSEKQSERTLHYTTMIFNASAPTFDRFETRATETWKDKDKVYIQFYNGNNRIDGQAIYNAEEDFWDVQYYSSISATENSICHVYFFENSGPINGTIDALTITLTEQTCIYCDKEAYYKFDGKNIVMTANLKPMTGRIRWKGEENQLFKFSGVNSYTLYDITNDTFESQPIACSGAINKNGYSPYFYAFFPTEEHEITFEDVDGNDVYYTRILGENALAQGHSGYLNLPTITQRGGWNVIPYPIREFTFSGNGKTIVFNMIYVEKGTFKMGSMSGNADEAPVHDVTLTKSYYIGETEITQGLWYAVMGQLPIRGPEYSLDAGTGDNYPVVWVTHSDCLQFIDRLNFVMGRTFRLPTEAEWEFAARGGNSTQNYLFAGSNNLDEVGWYWNNAGSISHEVKKKKPNELGIYDMSGNVREWCADWYGEYSSETQENPTGPSTGLYKVDRGGGWIIEDGAANGTVWCRTTSRFGNTGKGPFLGLRIVL